jgi:hypothetical protein
VVILAFGRKFLHCLSEKIMIVLIWTPFAAMVILYNLGFHFGFYGSNTVVYGIHLILMALSYKTAAKQFDQLKFDYPRLPIT